MITKVITPSNNSNSHNSDFHAQGRKVFTAPKILESYIADNGEVTHILDNQREQSDISYMAMWGKPKGIILGKGVKGDNPNQRKLTIFK